MSMKRFFGVRRESSFTAPQSAEKTPELEPAGTESLGVVSRSGSVHSEAAVINKEDALPNYETEEIVIDDENERYIHYEIYSDATRMPLIRPYSGPYVGRISLYDVAPPKSLDLVKACIPELAPYDAKDISFYRNRFETEGASIDATANLFTGLDYPGYASGHPVAFVVPRYRPLVVLRPPQIPVNIRREKEGSDGFVYYRLYSDSKRVAPAQAIEGQPLIGRIDISEMAPPRTIKVLKKYIATLESLEPLQVVDVFESDSALTALEENALTVKTVTSSSVEDPIAVTSIKNVPTNVRWNAKENTIYPQTFDNHTGKVYALAFSPDSKKLASGSRDGTLVVRDTVTGAILLQPPTKNAHKGPGYIISCCWSPAGTQIVTGSTHDVVIWDGLTGDQLVGPFTGVTNSIWSIAYITPQILVTGSFDKKVCTWNAHTGDQLSNLDPHSDAVTSVDVSPNKERVVTGSYDKSIRISDVISGRAISTITDAHDDKIHNVKYTPDGGRLISTSSDKTIKVWDANTGENVSTISGHLRSVRGLAVSADGKTVAASIDQQIRIWDLESGGECIAGPLLGHSEIVWTVAFSPDGKMLASGSGDTKDFTVRLWTARM